MSPPAASCCTSSCGAPSGSPSRWLGLGVALLIVQSGRPPWIALLLAGTWGAYSLMRKRSPLPAVTGLTVETLLLSLLRDRISDLATSHRGLEPWGGPI